jgi:hypothetical protein
MSHFSIERFRRVWARDAGPEAPTIRMAHTGVRELVIEDLADAGGEDLFQASADVVSDNAGRLALSLRPDQKFTSHAGSFSRLLA